MKNSKKQPTAIETTYKKIGLVEVTTPIQRSNGTRAFFDRTANCNFIFRQFSSPRIEYFSEVTNSVQSYKMFDPSGKNINEDMKEAIPYIVNRKMRGMKERTESALKIVSRLI